MGRKQDEQGQPRDRRALVFITVSLLLIGVIFINPGWIKPDSVGTYAYLRSMVIDRDLSFLNEWSGFELIRDDFTLFKETLEDGRVANHWWVGTSILSAPMFLAAHVSQHTTGGAIDGVSGAYTILLAWSSVAFTIGSLFFVWLLIQNRGVPRSSSEHDWSRFTESAVPIAAILVGTPLFFYTFRMSLGTHAAGTFLVGALTWLLLSERESRWEFLTGLVFGLTVATRLQHFTLAGGVAIHAWQARWSLRSWLLFIAGAAVGWSPQAAAWLVIYDTPLGPLARGSNLTGTTWSPFRDNAMLDVLFSGWHGLLIWSPVVFLAIAGWVFHLTKRPQSRVLLMMFVGQWLANGLLDRYFWGGLSFGPRRFVDLAVPFAIGIAWFVEWAAEKRRRGHAHAAIAITSGWSFALLLLTLGNRLELSRSTTTGDLLRSMTSLSSAVRDFTPAITRGPGAHFFAIVCTTILVLVFHRLVAGRKRLLAIGLTVALLVIDLAFLAVRKQTIEHAGLDSKRFGIDPRRSAVGPLIDQRALLRDLAEHLERSGDSEAEKKIRAEIVSVEREIGLLLQP